MDFAMSTGGLLIHSCDEWPCAICRPVEIAERRAYCLCVTCAQAMMAAAGAGEEGARALLSEITDALVQLETRAEHSGAQVN